MADKIDELNSSTSVQALTLPRDPNEAAAEVLMRTAATIAKMRKKLFDEYVNAGFTVDQALQLCVK